MDKLSSIEKSIQLLKLVSREPYHFSVSQLSKDSGINRTTVYRIMSVLESQDIVIRDSAGNYVIGPLVYSMGMSYLYDHVMHEKISEILNELSLLLKESLGMAIREGNKVISLFELELYQPLKMHYKPGIFYPMNKGCYGKLLMAYHDRKIVSELLRTQIFEKTAENTLTEYDEIIEEYDKILNQGYVTSISETFSYAVGVGVPVRNISGEVKACLAVSFLKKDDYIKKIEEDKIILEEYAAKISKYLL